MPARKGSTWSVGSGEDREGGCGIPRTVREVGGSVQPRLRLASLCTLCLGYNPGPARIANKAPGNRIESACAT